MTNPSDPSQPVIKSENTPENTLPDVDVEMENATNAPQQDPLAGAGDRIPAPAPVAARKDRNLREFLGMMEEYAPIIPDAVTDYYLSLSGLSTADPRLKRLLALATQKFIADIATDAYQYSRIRQNSSNAGGVPGIGALNAGAGGGTGGVGGGAGGGGSFRPIARPGFGGGGGSGGSAGRTVLTMEDLGSAVGEYGVNTRRPEFYR
ncbi:hypothetical protein Q9L58_000497 [Maublancomyces gigas]|uniref:Transcription initiation factor TFIID subunit 10 n=1 Tax=Discina gigas TaxID=1032678 RepID=A0ABR3GY58_9PEZI